MNGASLNGLGPDKAQNSKYPSRAGIGTSSILLIIVMLCLTVFAVLALISARADKRMTDNTVASVTAYYEADALAQKTLMQLHEGMKTGELPEGVSEQNGIFSFTVPVSQANQLEVAAQKTQTGYELISYKLVPIGEWDSGAWDSDTWDNLWG